MAIGTISNNELGGSVRAKLNEIIALSNTSTNLVKTVGAVGDLPAAVGGVITLLPDTTYYFLGDVDLAGARLVTSGTTCILGTSSETSSITSTGLTGQAVLTCEHTLPMRHITFKNCEVGVRLGDLADGQAAADWYGVNFLDCAIGVELLDVANFVFATGAFLGGSQMVVKGTFGSAVFTNSIFVSDGTAKASLLVESTAVINRRVRLTSCVFVTFASSNSINFSATASTPAQSYILETCNFSAGGVYLVGVESSDNKALFKDNVGIENSSDLSQYYMSANATVTPITTSGVAVKVLGTTTSSPATSKFTNTNNRATYTGALTTYFKTVATISVQSGNNNQIGVYVAKNGVIETSSEVYGTAGGSGRAENIVVQTILQLSQGDYVEIFVENSSSTQDITATDLNVIIE